MAFTDDSIAGCIANVRIMIFIDLI